MSQHPIERGIALLRDLVADDPTLTAELEGSRLAFFAVEPSADPESAERVLADRRHFEWFAFERPGDRGGESVAQELFDAWMERADVEVQVFANAMLHSRTGVFEVGDVDPENGLWLHDLLGLGAFPVADGEAAKHLETGDLVAGRIFPAGDAQFRLSPAVACFRNERLLEALRADLDSLRKDRRTTLRLAQIEIERMFFGPRGGSGEVDAVVDPEESAGDAATRLTAEFRDLLVDGGVESERAEAWLESLRTAAQVGGREVDAPLRTELLDQLAFETEVDLDRARTLLGEAWTAFAAEGRTPATAPVGEPDTPAPDLPPSGGREAVARALANFDRGREAGRDLDQLFAVLETELGIENDESDGADTAPDFPGVVGAVVDEYLWETAQKSEVATSERAQLEALGRYTRGLGVFEDLGPEHLTSFATRWAVDRGLVGGPAVARALLGTIERFARWVEEAHQTPLWTSFQRRADDLNSSLPRVAQANAALGSAEVDVGDPRRMPVVEDLAAGKLGVEDPSGWRDLEAPPTALDVIRAGDQVAADLSGATARVLRVYSPETIEIDPSAPPTIEPQGDGDDQQDDGFDDEGEN